MSNRTSAETIANSIRHIPGHPARDNWRCDDGAEFDTEVEARAHCDSELYMGQDIGATGPRPEKPDQWMGYDPISGLGRCFSTMDEARAYVDSEIARPRIISFPCLCSVPFFQGVSAWVSPARGGKWRAGIGVATSYRAVGVFDSKDIAEAAACAAAEAKQTEAIEVERRRIEDAGGVVVEIIRYPVTLRERRDGNTPGWAALSEYDA